MTPAEQVESAFWELEEHHSLMQQCPDHAMAYIYQVFRKEHESGTRMHSKALRDCCENLAAIQELFNDHCERVMPYALGFSDIVAGRLGGEDVDTLITKAGGVILLIKMAVTGSRAQIAEAWSHFSQVATEGRPLKKCAKQLDWVQGNLAEMQRRALVADEARLNYLVSLPR